MRKAKIPRKLERWAYLAAFWVVHVPEKDPGSHRKELAKTGFECVNLKTKSWFSLFGPGYIGGMDDA